MQAADRERLRSTLAEVWTSGGRRFATFEDEGDDDVFVQYFDGQLNVAWPLERDPAAELPRRGAALTGGAFVISFAPGETALLAVGDLTLDEVARLIERILERVLGATDIVCRTDADR